MDRIVEAGHRIRSFVNEEHLYDQHFSARLDEWNRVTVAMDTLDDSASALSHFEEYGLGASDSERYLRFYGVFQALILQQDSIQELHRVFQEEELPSELPQWRRVRDLRNMATGHPLDKRGTAEEGRLRIFVSQTSISEDGFDLLICKQLTDEQDFESVDFASPYTGYKDEAVQLLAQIESAQSRRWGAA